MEKLKYVIILWWTIYNVDAQTKFTDVSLSSGIDHHFEVYEGFLGGGACVLDVNNDGFEDLYLTGGVNIDRLYINQKDGTFKDILQGSGLEITTGFITQGVASADVNKDGWPDLFITTNTTAGKKKTIPRAINLLFLNNGDNTFKNVTKEFGLGAMYSFSTGVSFGDFNGDGYPDAYVGNYFHEYTGELNEINDATIVSSSTTAHGYLLINKAGKRFVNVYEDYGLSHKGFGFGGLFTDFDNDGDQDILVNHDFGYKATPNYLLENQFPIKKFEYVEEAKGMDLRINAMASAVGDYDNNGWLDYFVTNIKFNWFMVNQDKGSSFVDKASELGMRLFTISWGANFADFDNDTDLDLFVANGDLNPNCKPMNNYLFENENNKFLEHGSLVGLNDYGIGRGSVVFDFDNDGDQDLLVVNQKPVLDYPVTSTTKLYRNDSTHGNWLKVKLNGYNSESRGVGSRVRIVSGDLSMIREIDGGGSSHLSQNSTIAHFGLGSKVAIDSVIITWLGGEKQVLVNQEINQLLDIHEVVAEQIASKKYRWIKWMFVISILAVLLFIYVNKLKSS